MRQTRRDTCIAPDKRDLRHAADEGAACSSPQPVKQSSKAKRSLRGRALAYLSRREHSRDELARKLTPFIEASDGDDPVPTVLNRLAEEGLLSDARFAQSVVNRRAARFGSTRIVGELKRHKVDSDTVQTISESLRDTEWERISDVWARKFGVLAVTQQERAKQARFLASRGFSHDAIMRIIKAGYEDMPIEE
jgi:regulatory protein